MPAKGALHLFHCNQCCLSLLVLLALAVLPIANCLGCFACTSMNNSLPLCEDTFGNVGSFFNSNCQAARVGRTGLFPATECIKIKLLDPRDQTKTIIRTCVVDNGGNSDNTEIGRSTHCGPMQKVKWQGVLMYGCILTCKTDGCNGSARQSVSVITLLLAVPAVLAANWLSGFISRIM